MSGFFDDYIARTEPEAKEFCVDVTTTLRLWFKVDGDFGEMAEREEAIKAQFDGFTKYTDGKFEKFVSLHPSWPVPSRPIVLFNVLSLMHNLVRGEKLVDGEWVESPVHIPDIIKLSQRGAVFSEVIRRMSVGMVSHVKQGEDEAQAAAEKKSIATNGTSTTSESDSE